MSVIEENINILNYNNFIKFISLQWKTSSKNMNLHKEKKL